MGKVAIALPFLYDSGSPKQSSFVYDCLEVDKHTSHL